MLTRRRLAQFMFTAFVALRGRIVSADEDDVNVSIRVDESVRGRLAPMEEEGLAIGRDTSPQAQALAEKTPAGKAIPIMLLIVGAIAIVRLLEMIQELYRKTYYGGVLIDNRTKPPTITNDLKIPASMVFVIDAQGKTTRFEGDKFDLSMLRAALKK